MLTYAQAIILGALQGLTELFPVSSLGHSVILPSLLGWKIDQEADFFLIFLVATHTATSLVLLGFFWRDWLRIVRTPRFLYIIVIATIPVGLLGLIFEHKLKILFDSPIPVAGFLVLNGIILYISEVVISRRSSVETHTDDEIGQLPTFSALKVGFAQALALFPGISRTGSTLAGGLVVGLNHRNAARFSFLLATPIILAASALKLPELLVHSSSYPIGAIIAGSVASGIFAYFSVKFLTKYFETKTLKPFAYYCMGLGILSLIMYQI